MPGQSAGTWRPAPFAIPRRYPRGQTMVRAGDPAASVHLIRRGQVRLYRLSAEGCETTTAVLGPGQLVGLGAVLGRPMHEEFAETLDATDVWVLPADALLRQLTHDRPLLGLVAGALAARLAQEVALLQDVALLTVSERAREVETVLTQQLGEPPRLIQRTLAQLVDARPETLSRVAHAPADRARRRRAASGAQPAIRFRGSRWSAQHAALAPTASPETELARGVADLPGRLFRAGEAVTAADRQPHGLFVVREGLVRLYLAGPAGREVTVDVVASGSSFGLESLGADRARLCALALTDARVCAVPAAELVRRLDQHPAALRELVGQIGARLERVERCLARVEAPNARGRLANLLLQLAEDLGEPLAGGGRRLPAGWSHEALARQIGYRRETVSRALAGLAAAGYVRQERRRLIVPDPRRVREDFRLDLD